MKLKQKLFTLLMIMAMVLTACGTVNKNTESNVTPEITKEVTPEVTPEEVNLKIVSFSPSITEIIYALGAQDYLIGRTDYCDYPKQALEIESIGSFYTPDVEKVVSLEPDYVLASTLWTDEVAVKFKEAGIEVKTFIESNKVEDVYSLITNIADAVGKSNEAATIIEGMKQELKEIENKIKGLAKKTVYYVSSYGDSGDYTATGDTYIHDMLTLAGGDNIAKDASNWSYSLEKLIEHDPEIIFIASFMKDDFLSNANYQNLSAVKNGQVYGIDNNLLDRQTNRTIKGIRMLAEIIHPEAFQ